MHAPTTSPKSTPGPGWLWRALVTRLVAQRPRASMKPHGVCEARGAIPHVCRGAGRGVLDKAATWKAKATALRSAAQGADRACDRKTLVMLAEDCEAIADKLSRRKEVQKP